MIGGVEWSPKSGVTPGGNNIVKYVLYPIFGFVLRISNSGTLKRWNS